jgi:hypothetical protein
MSQAALGHGNAHVNEPRPDEPRPDEPRAARQAPGGPAAGKR